MSLNEATTSPWLDTLIAAVRTNDKAEGARLVLRALGGVGASTTVLVQAAPPDWKLIAAAPEGSDTPIHLAADAVDAEQPVREGDWLATPIAVFDGPPAALLVKSPPGLTVPQATINEAAQTLAILDQMHRVATHAGQMSDLLAATKSWRAAGDLRALLEQMAESACQLFAADRASIFLWDKPNRTLVGRPALGVEGGELRIPDDAGVVGAVLHSREPQRVSPRNDGAIDRSTDKKTGYQTDTLLCVPLVDRSRGDGELLGVFELLNKQGGVFTSEDERGLADLADYAAVALAATQQFEELLERHEQMVDQAASGARLLGECSAIAALRSTVDRVADTDLAILILGENGSGKEVVAQSLHYQSGRRNEPFVAVNCAAIAETLLESELFGHEKGAFTDAQESRAGKFELAAGGTILLDEIGDMSLGGQAKLLRVLEEKTVVRVGGGVPIETDVRVLAATNQDLAALVREKRFREDLYFRLNVVSIDLPPLRRRGEDVLLLAEHFLATFCRAMGRRTPKFTAAARKRMLAHRWPGNVRELRNLMERVAYLSSGTRVEADDLAFTIS
ncbi:MAG: sigma-54-dependent Fis family transcriptional regulator, partial [Planctomycetota bacterium]